MKLRGNNALVVPVLPDLRKEYLEHQNLCRDCRESESCSIRYFLKDLEEEDKLKLLVIECRTYKHLYAEVVVTSSSES